ncbi:MAG: endonuclease V [Acidilobus sp.]
MRTRAFEACEAIRSSFSYQRAVRAQLLLRSRVNLTWPGDHVLEKGVAAVDASYWGPGELFGVAVVVTYDPSGNVIACHEAYGPVCVPYVPGLLAFREARLMIPALASALKARGVGLILVDGHGIAHPRRFGIASHLGVVLSTPSIGVAKSLLYGDLVPCALGTCIEANGEVLGVVLEGSGKRVFVSPGNQIDVNKAFEVARSMMREGYGVPYPLALADRLSKLERKRLSSTMPKEVVVQRCDGVLSEVLR